MSREVCLAHFSSAFPQHYLFSGHWLLAANSVLFFYCFAQRKLAIEAAVLAHLKHNLRRKKSVCECSRWRRAVCWCDWWQWRWPVNDLLHCNRKNGSAVERKRGPVWRQAFVFWRRSNERLPSSRTACNYTVDACVHNAQSSAERRIAGFDGLWNNCEADCTV